MQTRQFPSLYGTRAVLLKHSNTKGSSRPVRSSLVYVRARPSQHLIRAGAGTPGMNPICGDTLRSDSTPQRVYGQLKSAHAQTIGAL